MNTLYLFLIPMALIVMIAGCNGEEPQTIHSNQQESSGQVAANRIANLGLVAVAVHSYHDAYKELPFRPTNDGHGNLSWRARIAQFIEGPQDIDLSKSHDDPANAKFANQMPNRMGGNGISTDICWIEQENTPVTLEEISDGTANTIMLLQSRAAGPWMEPSDLTVDEAVALITGLQEDQFLIAAFYDGSDIRIGPGLTEEEIRPFLVHNDGIRPDWEALYKHSLPL